MTVYDISQTLRPGIPVWPGEQKYSYRWSMQMKKGDPCNLSAVTMSVHTGTHIDAPFHFDPSAPDIADMPLEPYVGPARVVPLDVERFITAGDLEPLEWDGVRRVLFKTRSSGRPADRFHRDFASLAEDAVNFLGDRRMLLVGTDAPSVDAFNSSSLGRHKLLLKHGIAILEGIRLAHVPSGDYELICLPLKLAGLDGSPVRAVLRSQ